MDMTLSVKQELNLGRVGYTPEEIATFKASAQNESDVEFLKSIASGDYESAFKIAPSSLSEVCKMQLSNYEAIMATRADAGVYEKQIAEQANALFAQKTYAHTPMEYEFGEQVNTYDEYFDVISEGYNQQSEYYAEYMQYMCDNNMTVSDEYLNYGENLNSAKSLWNSFEELNQRGNKNFDDFELMYGHALRDGACNIKIMNVAKDASLDQYGYAVKLVNPSTQEAWKTDCNINVQISQSIGSDVLSGLILNDNRELRAEKEALKGQAMLNTAISTYDAMVPFPVKDGYEMVMAFVGDDKTEAKLLCAQKGVNSGLDFAGSDDMQLTNGETLGKVAEGLGVVTEIADGVISYQNDCRKIDAQILENNHKLSIAQSGQLTEMKMSIMDQNGESLSAKVALVGEGNVLPEVQYNMARWQAQGIDAYLDDLNIDEETFELLGVDDLDGLKDKLESELDPKALAQELYEDDKVSNEKIEEMDYAVKTMLDGGDFSQISSENRGFVQRKINDLLGKPAEEADMQDGLNAWVLKRNDVEVTAKEDNISLDDKSTEKINLLTEKLTLFRNNAGMLQFADMLKQEQENVIPSRLYINPAMKENTSNELSKANDMMTR